MREVHVPGCAVPLSRPDARRARRVWDIRQRAGQAGGDPLYQRGQYGHVLRGRGLRRRGAGPVAECVSGGVPSDGGKSKIGLAFSGKVTYNKLRYFAGVMELADVVDSKSHSSVVTTSAEALDFSRKFDNSICK